MLPGGVDQLTNRTLKRLSSVRESFYDADVLSYTGRKRDEALPIDRRRPKTAASFASP